MAPFKMTGAKKTRHDGIKKLSDGRWFVRRTWIDERTGQRIQRKKVVEGTVETAQKAWVELRGQEKSTSGEQRPRFRSFAEEWLKLRKSKLERSTHHRYTGDVGNLNVTFGEWWIDAIDYASLEKWQSESREKFAAATVNSWHRTMRVILDSAGRRGLMKTNPARDLTVLPEGRTRGPRGTPFTSSQLCAFIQAIPQCIEAKTIRAAIGRGLYVYAWTGMRAGEILALRWSDVLDGEFHVERSVWRGHEKTDKTDDPRRITVVEPLAAILDEQRRWLLTSQHPGLESGLIFPANPQQARGGAVRRKGEVVWFRSQTTFQDAIAEVCKKAEVPRATPHALRRTFENLTREAGVEPLVRRAIHGWRSERTEAIYATVRREERDAAAQAVVRLVLGGPS